jgi:hypothetical protein
VSDAEPLLLDEMFAPKLADQLRAEGFDVVAVAGHATLAAALDEEVMQWAAAQSRRFPWTRRNPSPLLDALRRWLKQPAGHAGPVDWPS